MSVVDIHEAKTHLSRLVDEAVRGAEVVIARANSNASAREARVGIAIESRPGAGTRITLRAPLGDRMFIRRRPP